MKHLRREYGQTTLSEEHLLRDPFEQFGAWFRDCMESGVPEPNAMVLSTVSATGQPSSRMVLLKEFNSDGFVFFTNYLSQKSQDIDTNPAVSLLFFWGQRERQVRLEGTAYKIAGEASDEYFYSRPPMSQAGAIASPQSQEIPDRDLLEKRFLALQSSGEPLMRPVHWGGYVVRPNYFEFWQGRENRLHDRFAYRLENEGWRIARLAP